MMTSIWNDNLCVIGLRSFDYDVLKQILISTNKKNEQN